MYLRDLSGKNLEDLINEFDQRLTTWGGVSQQMTPHLEEDTPFVDLNGTEVRVGREGLESLAKFFDIPPKFFMRLERDQQQYLLRTQIERADVEVTANYSEGRGLSEIRPAGEVRVRPHKLLEAALSTFPANSPVVDYWNDHSELRVDLILPEGFERGIGGDPGVGDLTRGGVRIGQDRKVNKAPWVQKYLYRLVCTNGMEVPDAGLKISAQGASEEEIYALFNAEVARAVDSLEQEIQAFYALRDEKLGTDPTGALRRVALEQNLPLRTVGSLEDLVPVLVNEADGNEISMFDVVNLMTNQANNPALDRRSTSVRNLQLAGGRLVNDHMERCNACHSRLGR